MTHAATAIAHPNIALIKYWGKRDEALNLPASGSLSITLDTIKTRTMVRFDPTINQDEFTLNGKHTRPPSNVSATLDHFRRLAEIDHRALIDTNNNFPTAAGLASSASGYAALCKACDGALNLNLGDAQLSELSRLGSGSAARSIYGGFVLMNPGMRSDGKDAIAEPLRPIDYWPLNVIIAITSTSSKPASSTHGMNHSRRTSPYYDQWACSVPADLSLAQRAIESQDFEALAVVSESSCLKMHACMLSSDPGLIYWNGATVEAMHRVRELRANGVPVFFTIDAGPQPKAICLPTATSEVSAALGDLHGVHEVIRTGIGTGATAVDP